MQKIKYLDGIRGLAAYLVVFHHFILAFYPALFFGENAQSHIPGGFEVFASGSIINLFYNGNLAVCVFFMLSGFVLSWKFFNTKDYEVIVASAIKRYFRLVFPIAFSILLAYLALKFSLFYNQQVGEIYGLGWLSAFWNFAPDFKDALSQGFYGTFFTGDYYYNTVLWTISFEFFGAFLIFGFLLLFGKNKYRIVFYLPFLFFFLQTYYLAFLLGMLLSDLTANAKMILPKVDRFKILRALLLLTGLYVGSYPSGRAVDGTMYDVLHFMDLDTLPQIWHIVGAFLIILVLLNSKQLQKMFSKKTFVLMGDLSFAVYLVHFIVMGSFASFIFLKLAPLMPYALAFAVTFTLSVGLVSAMAWLMHVTLEKYTFEFSQLIYALFKRIINFRFAKPRADLIPE